MKSGDINVGMYEWQMSKPSYLDNVGFCPLSRDDIRLIQLCYKSHDMRNVGMRTDDSHHMILASLF